MLSANIVASGCTPGIVNGDSWLFEKTLLLQLKAELIFDSSLSTKLVQWNESDECCTWSGVQCDAFGYVISLQLDGEAIYGGIWNSSSLFKFKYLQKLNLAYNRFSYKRNGNLTHLTHLSNNAIPIGNGNLTYSTRLNQNVIPKGIGNLAYLTHLNLSYAGFSGQVPSEISSLSRLVSLDISYLFGLIIEHPNLEMLVQNLTGLRELYLDYIYISSPYERRKWSHIISSYLPNLTSLSLSSCNLHGPFSKSVLKLHSLSVLRLDRNNLSAVGVLDSLANFPSLTNLSLASCGLKGSIPSSFANLTKLIHIHLPSNHLSGSLSPTIFEGLSNLVHLDLAENLFSGNVPHSLLALPLLLELDLSFNRFSGTFQLENLRSLVNLTFMSLSESGLSVDVGNVTSSSYGFVHLKVLTLASCNVSDFPVFIKHSDLELLDLSNNRIAGEIPSWIWGAQLMHLDLSFNLLTGMQKPYYIPPSLKFIFLHSNRLRGELQLPVPLESRLWTLSLHNNSLSGSIPTSLCDATSLRSLNLFGNRFSGGIPSCLLENLTELNLGLNNLSGSIPDISSMDCRLIYLKLSNNALEGNIPMSLGSCRSLLFIDVANNNISGSIPDSFPSDCRLVYFVLNNNNLEGTIPKSLESCRSLQLMNIGNNMINDTFPCMLASTLRVLVLHSNRFHGEVKCQNRAERLQVLDIASNDFSGSLESIDFSSWWAMRFNHRDSYVLNITSVTLIMKGLNLELKTIWPDFGSIDFSSNNFYGGIPNAIGDLYLLHHVNFSHNALNGSIPKSFGQLRELESLDLSGNQLTGLIPVELGELTFLEVLNLSYNKLVGKIPNGRQFQTFSVESFEGNPGLCGFPLRTDCSHTDGSDSGHDGAEEKREIEWEYVSVAVGYVVALGIFVWLLLFCRSFSDKYFDKLDEIVEEICDGRNRRRRRARRRHAQARMMEANRARRQRQ
ncbi:receptor-like protein 7 [Salvia hispanica]|uniref:receptor-like protein 7 n=1 Tax=Salvia hispanica TaxID=49212 RepID=UPI002009D4FE|nr:receptor-like protein 7 [Salvia hispanica]